MFSTITGKKFRIKNDSSIESVKQFVSNQTGADINKIIIYNTFIGFFNNKNDIETSTNQFKDFGVPDGVYFSEDFNDDFLDYEKGQIVKEKKIKSFLGCSDVMLTSRIFKHLLCEKEEDEIKIENNNVNVDELITKLENSDQLCENDKQLICDNIDGVIMKMFSLN